MQKTAISQPHVIKKVLKNGMTVLVRVVRTIPKVSIQLWYGVGSRNESDKERGIAHLIEHMIFKGTKKITESDINVLTHRLSGNCNAFTSYDFTGYLFNFPSHHWQESFPVMADCMTNCTFKEDMLASEMKAVIQELKMYRDYYARSLIDELISAIFTDHPYHHPIIGYKQDLWSVGPADLHAFYKKHYVPNNATLVVVGDVDPEEVFAQAEKYFEQIPANPDYKKELFYCSQDIASRSITLYRDVQHPTAVFTFVMPGTCSRTDHVQQLLSWVIGRGKSSRLYKRIVEDEQLATSFDASAEDLFDHGLFMIFCEPKDTESIARIEAIIAEELCKLVKEGISSEEFTKALKHTQMGLYELLEDTEHQASEIGKYFLATGDEEYVFNALEQPHEKLKEEAEAIVRSYMRPPVMHKGMILPMPESEKAVWRQLQELSDQEDEKILSARVRNTPVEPAQYAYTVEVKQPGRFDFPKAKVRRLDNGLRLFTSHNKNTPKIDIVLDLKADALYDPEDKQGLSYFMSKMLAEGTERFTADEFAFEVEKRGMSINFAPGIISMSVLPEDLEFALELLRELVSKVRFDETKIEKVRKQIATRINSFWDNPNQFAGQLLRENIYHGHPYSKNTIGTRDSVAHITRDDLIAFYREYMSPQEARLMVVGDFDETQLHNLVDTYFGTWTGKTIADIVFPTLKQVSPAAINYQIDRDQVVLSLARLSVNRLHPDYNKLLLFDQIFGGGVLGSMSSRLFQLREESGLFYTINGSSIAGADEEPGMFLVRTIVSRDRLDEAEKAIKQTIKEVIDSLTAAELEEAKHAVLNSMVDYFASNEGIAKALLFIDRFKLPADYFDTRASEIEKISLDEVKEAARKIIHHDNLLVLTVGRVDGDREQRPLLRGRDAVIKQMQS